MTFDNNEMDGGDYTVVFKNVMEDEKSHPVVRALACDMMKQPYLRVGEWLGRASDDTMQILSDLVEDVENPVMVESMLLMGMMFSQAEGVYTVEEDDVMRATNMMTVFITLENLYRKGLIELTRENMSFGEDANNLPVATAKRIED